MARFFIALHHQLYFLIINFVFHYIIKVRKQHNWQSTSMVNAGTWVRFPGPPIYFILFLVTCFYAAFIQRSIIHPTPWRATCPQGSIQRSGSGVYHMHQSAVPHTRQESQHGLAFHGPNCLHMPPNWVRKPPMFALSSLFFFLFFYLF